MANILRSELIRLRSLINLVEIYDLIVEDSREGRLRNVDCLYIFGQTKDNEKESFLSSKRLIEKGLSKKVFISDAPEGRGFPGFDSWFNNLETQYNIIPLPVPMSKRINTLTESEALVRYSLGNNSLTSLYIIAPEFCFLRNFMTSSSVAIRENPKLNVFAYFAKQDWNQVVFHSQGIVRGRRIDLIETELERIKKYQEKGDIEPTLKIIDYTINRK